MIYSNKAFWIIDDNKQSIDVLLSLSEGTTQDMKTVFRMWFNFLLMKKVKNGFEW